MNKFQYQLSTIIRDNYDGIYLDVLNIYRESHNRNIPIPDEDIQVLIDEFKRKNNVD
ncbi:hypothetical protein [Staphylococcus phage Stab20]|nr:hypothetical protein [Staphylococcus phage Stab20]